MTVETAETIETTIKVLGALIDLLIIPLLLIAIPDWFFQKIRKGIKAEEEFFKLFSYASEIKRLKAKSKKADAKLQEVKDLVLKKRIASGD